mmetsp:Transcript_23878/g.67105  ORF Transcript_23878/g.67105 Transcript_23878/m.67105 type:complete len:217 (-) Transcript_23878:347-997(-)
MLVRPVRARGLRHLRAAGERLREDPPRLAGEAIGQPEQVPRRAGVPGGGRRRQRGRGHRRHGPHDGQRERGHLGQPHLRRGPPALRGRGHRERRHAGARHLRDFPPPLRRGPDLHAGDLGRDARADGPHARHHRARGGPRDAAPPRPELVPLAGPRANLLLRPPVLRVVPGPRPGHAPAGGPVLAGRRRTAPATRGRPRREDEQGPPGDRHRAVPL